MMMPLLNNSTYGNALFEKVESKEPMRYDTMSPYRDLNLWGFPTEGGALSLELWRLDLSDNFHLFTVSGTRPSRL